MDLMNIEFEIDPDLLKAASDFFREPPSGKLLNDIGSVEDETNQSVVPARRKPVPRKGHTKSRRGCYSCKRRKIKCQETRPACGHCLKGGIKCDYPILVQETTLTILSPTPILQPQSTPVVFSMKDMQFFHHFLVRAYPHLPVGADKTWTMQIPAFAQEVGILL
jgi:hypothetical protein